MESSRITIVKRDGKKEAFSIDKIKNAVQKAFLSVGAFAADDDMTSILGRLRISDGMSVEEIQNQVEVALMAERCFAVAKSYMLYRQSHYEDREVRDHIYDTLIRYRFSDWEWTTDTVLYPTPYQAVVAVTELAAHDKAAAVKRLEKYLKREWYRGHSDLSWHDDHKYGINHDGYWSFESGALVKVLGLDDSSLKGLPYYPYDMVHWNDNIK